MTAVACLRVLLPEDRFTDPDALVALVNKFGGAFLENRWAWPRRWSALAPFAFALADPRTDKLDPAELQALSAELQHKLFGDGGEGDVRLVMLQGHQDDIMRFALADAGLLREMIARGGGAVRGALNTITPSTVTTLETLDSRPPFPDETPALPEESASPDRKPFDYGFRGVYHTGREIFIGSVVVARHHPKAPLWSVVDGLRDMPVQTIDHDLACLEVAREALARPGGILFVPINFSALVHGATRRIYEASIAQLPISQRGRLAAAIYEMPRDPAWGPMSQIKTLLAPRFALIDLQIADPAFAVDKLPEDGGVTSVTFALPEGDEKTRLLAAGRFMGNLAAFRRRRVWPGLTNVRSRRELAAALTLKTPFITGRAVTATLRRPPDASPRDCSSLPLQAEEFGAFRQEVAMA